MSDYGFKNYQLNDSKHFYRPKITISDNILKGYMLSIKVKEWNVELLLIQIQAIRIF